MVKKVRNIRCDIPLGSNQEKRRDLMRFLHLAKITNYEVMAPKTKNCVCRCYNVDSESYELLIFELRASRRNWTVIWN